jgi:exonuclease 3'-5' domain-containing protein 1
MAALDAIVSGLTIDDAAEVPPTQPGGYVLVETTEACSALSARIVSTPTSIALDIEGVDLCREGEVCIIQVHVANEQTTYLIDITTMGSAAFTEGGLGDVITGETTKVMFDCRSDADALFHKYGLRLANVIDVQVLYCRHRDRERGHRDRYVKGLKHAFDAFSGIPYLEQEQLATLKDQGRLLFAPEKGGSYDVWRARPLDPVLAKYAASDVKHLGAMADEWRRRSDSDADLKAVAQARIDTTVDGNRTPRGRFMAIKDF